MRPNVETAPVDQLPDNMDSLERSFRTSKMAEKAAVWDRRVTWFRSRPRLVQRLLGGKTMLSLLEACYDIALEDYIQETNERN